MRHLIKFGAVIAGATAGAALGVLLTPEKGKKIRTKIVDHLKSGVAGVNDSKETLKGFLSEFTSSKKENFETTLTSIIDKAADKTEQVITILEHKLAEMKKGNKKVQPHSTSDIKDDVVYKAAYETKVDL